jgi:hypothetical protein
MSPPNVRSLAEDCGECGIAFNWLFSTISVHQAHDTAASRQIATVGLFKATRDERHRF